MVCSGLLGWLNWCVISPSRSSKVVVCSYIGSYRGCDEVRTVSQWQVSHCLIDVVECTYTLAVEIVRYLSRYLNGLGIPHRTCGRL